MITCPVCEHQQDTAFECEVCGKDLGGLSALGPPPALEVLLEGLEPNAVLATAQVPVERLPELEATRFEPAAALGGAAPGLLDLEANQLAPAGEVAVERVPDLSEDRAPDDGLRTVLATDSVTCRYCRTVQAPAASCARCGMSLPRLEPAAVAPGLAEPLEGRCRACGAPGLAGERCGECGRVLPFP
jgi:hypothetical protein